MAKQDIQLFNFYRKYLWRAVDFETLQQSVMDSMHGPDEGLLGAAVLSGMDYQSSTGLNVTVSAGIAVAATGDLLCATGSTQVALSVPIGNPALTMVVARPNITQQNNITKPEDPFTTVPLNTQHGTSIVVLNGTPSATPNYQAKGVNDVILFGVRLSAGATGFSSSDLDFEITETPGKNSELAQLTFHHDNRLKPYRSSNAVMGIKPAQSNPGVDTRAFTYALKGVPSVYPKSSGVFTFADSLLNFSTGAITGGDTDSPDFTPTIPTGTNCIFATVCLSAEDLVSVKYGIQGTRAQCMDALENMLTSGAGSLSIPDELYKVAFVLVQSVGGVVSNITVYDARGIGQSSQSTGIKNLIINGGMDIAQELTSVSINSAADPGHYVCDMFQTSSSGPTTKNYSVEQDSSSVPSIAESGYNSLYCLTAKILTGLVMSDPGDYICPANYYMEGFDFAEINQQSVTFGFWAKSNVVGVFNFALQSISSTRAYVTTFNIDQADTWEFKSITIALDTGSSFNLTNAASLAIQIGAVTGSTYTTSTLNQWVSASVFGANTQTNWMANTNAYLSFTQLSLVKGLSGAGAKGFTRKGSTFAEELIACQRYFEKDYDLQDLPGAPSAGNGRGRDYVMAPFTGTLYHTSRFKVSKRSSPTMIYYSPLTGAAGVVRDESGGADVAIGVPEVGQNSSAVNFAGIISRLYTFHWTANARF